MIAHHQQALIQACAQFDQMLLGRADCIERIRRLGAEITRLAEETRLAQATRDHGAVQTITRRSQQLLAEIDEVGRLASVGDERARALRLEIDALASTVAQSAFKKRGRKWQN